MTNFNLNIFRAYDIRGKYPEEINKKSAFFIARALVLFLKKELKKKKLTVALGRDSRTSSPVLSRAFKQGLLTENVDVFDLGLCTTPMLYWAVNFFSLDGGVQTTASHLAGAFNGFKMLSKKNFIGQNTGLNKIKTIFEKEIILKKGNFKQKGRIKKKEILKDYLNFNLQGFEKKIFQNLKVVVDTGNAVAGMIVPLISRLLDMKIYHLFSQLKGNFPHHEPDPTKEENIRFLSKEVVKKKADFGVAFDGDGDRIVFVDEKGKMVLPNFILVLLAKEILKEKKGAKIVYDIRASRIVKEEILKAGGRPVVSRVGHTFMKELMKKERAILGGESSAHYLHKDHYYCEAPIFVFLKMAEILVKSRKKFSQLIEPLKRYFSVELNIEIKEKEKTLEKLKRYFSGGRVNTLDGVRIDFKDWWFIARPSNTEPVMRLFIEAKNKKILNQKQKEIIKVLNS